MHQGRCRDQGITHVDAMLEFIVVHQGSGFVAYVFGDRNQLELVGSFFPDDEFLIITAALHEFHIADIRNTFTFIPADDGFTQFAP